MQGRIGAGALHAARVQRPNGSQGLKLRAQTRKITFSTLPTKDAQCNSEFFNYNKIREEATKTLCNKLTETYFPVLNAINAAGVLPIVGEQIQAFADELQVGRDEPLRVLVANLSYVGSAATGLCMDVAQLVGDMIASSPATTCALIIYPNAPSSEPSLFGTGKAFKPLESFLGPRWGSEERAQLCTMSKKPGNPLSRSSARTSSNCMWWNFTGSSRKS